MFLYLRTSNFLIWSTNALLKSPYLLVLEPSSKWKVPCIYVNDLNIKCLPQKQQQSLFRNHAFKLHWIGMIIYFQMMKQKAESSIWAYKTNSKNTDFPINLLSDPSNFKEHISCFNLI